MCTRYMQWHSPACQHYSEHPREEARLRAWSWFSELLVSARASLALGSGGGPAMGAGAGAIAPCKPTGPGKLLCTNGHERKGV